MLNWVIRPLRWWMKLRRTADRLVFVDFLCWLGQAGCCHGGFTCPLTNTSQSKQANAQIIAAATFLLFSVWSKPYETICWNIRLSNNSMMVFASCMVLGRGWTDQCVLSSLCTTKTIQNPWIWARELYQHLMEDTVRCLGLQSVCKHELTWSEDSTAKRIESRSNKWRLFAFLGRPPLDNFSACVKQLTQRKELDSSTAWKEKKTSLKDFTLTVNQQMCRWTFHNGDMARFEVNLVWTVVRKRQQLWYF